MSSEVLSGFLPDLVSKVSENAADPSGEVTSGVSSYVTNSDGQIDTLDNGNFYAIMSGSGATMEVVGVVVVEQDDPRFNSSVKAQETGGFILYRQ